MRHAIILESDAGYRKLLERVFADLHWSTAQVGSLEEAGKRIAGAWAAVLAIESGDAGAPEVIRELHQTAPETVICVLVDEHFPDFDRQLKAVGVDAVITKPVQEREIVEALVSGFTSRRGRAS